LREEIERLKRDLKKSESIENELRRTVDEHVREKNDLQTAKEQVRYSVG
jgi:ribosomal protein S13